MRADAEYQLLVEELLRTRSAYFDRGARHLVERIDAVLIEVGARLAPRGSSTPPAA